MLEELRLVDLLLRLLLLLQLLLLLLLRRRVGEGVRVVGVVVPA